MKLHLPKGLRAALIAAIATIGFTLPQAWAADPVQLTLQPTDKLSVSGGVGSMTAGNSKILWTGGDSTLNSWRITLDLLVTDGAANDFFNISSNHQTAQAGWSLGVNGTNLQLAVNGKNGSPVITLTDAFSIGSTQSITFEFVRNVDEDNISLGTGTFTVTSGTLTQSYTVESLDDTALVSDTRGHLWCNGNPGKEQLTNITLYQLDDHAVVVPTSTWNGTSTAHDWNDNVWNGTEPYADGNKAVFGANAYTTVSITSAVQASAVSVSAQNYTFETDASGSLEASKMNIADGYGLTVRGTVEGAGEVNIAALSGAGSLTVGANGTATVTSLSNYSGAMGVTDGGTLNLGASVQLDNLTVADGTVTTQHSGGSGVIVNDLNINAGGVFRVAGQHDAFGYGTGTTKNIILKGEEGNIAELQLQQTTTNSVTMNANLQLKGYAHITTTANGFNTHDGAIYAEGEDNSIDQFQLRRAATIEVAEDGVLTVGDMTYGADGQHILTKTGKGTLSFTGTANMQALKLQDGILVIDGGTATVTVENIATAPSTINKTIILRAGTLDVTTAVLDISGMGGIDTKGYSDGQVAGNGFATVGGTIDVVNVGESATLSHDGVQVKYNGMDLTMNDQGDVVVEEQKSLAAFYVNVDGSAESLDNAVTKGGGELTTVNLADNTTLNADSADAVLATLLVRENASATVELTQDLAVDTVTTAGKALTLSGAGVLSAGALQGAGNVVIGTGTTLALNGIGTAYTGSFTAAEGGTLLLTTNSLPEILTVNGEGALRMLVNAGGQNIDPQKVVAKNVVLAADEQHNSRFRYVTATDLSGVEHLSFEGGQLWLNNKDMTGDNAFAGTVTFGTTVYSEGNAFGGAALRVDKNGTFSGAVEVKENTKFTWGANMTVEFAGAVTGSGNLELARYNGNGTFKISGDAAAYAGAMTSHANVALSVEEGGRLTLAGGSNLSGAVTIGGELTMNSAESTTSTIGGGISGSGTLNKAGTGTLEVSGAAAATSTVAVNVNEGTLKVSAANALGGGAITVAEDGTLELVNGGTLGTAQTVTNSGNVLIHSTLTQGTVNGGTLTLAPDFPDDGEILDVGGQTTGNGFSQGGVMHVYTPGSATLTGEFKVMKGGVDYTEQLDENGNITTDTPDWYTYQLNGEAQYAVQAIMDYAKENGGELKTISVNDNMLTIENDSTTLKTSMLGGEHLATFAVYMSDTSGLTIDGNCGAAISTNTGAEGTITLETDATVGSIVAGDFENSGAGNLTINGEGRTVKADGAGAAFGGVLALGKGVTLELLHDTSFTTVMNATVKLGESASLVLNEVSFSTVEGGTGATIEVTSDEYIPMYAPHIAEYSITGARITYNTTAAFDLGHVIDATSQVVNAGTGSLRDISANEEYAELNAKGGDIYISAAEGTDARALIVGDLTLAEGRTVAEDTGKAVSITVNGTASFGSGTTVGAALTMAGGSTLNGQAALANHSLALGTNDGGTLKIGDALWSTLNGLPALGSMNLFTGVSALTLAGKEYTEDVDLSTIFTRDGLKANKYMLSYDTTSKNVVITRQADNNRYWKGGDGMWNYTEKQWLDEETGGSEATFEEGYNAYFTNATTGTVTLGTDIIAESITVSGADYTFAPSAAQTLTVNKSVEADGHKAIFNLALNGENLKLTAKNNGQITLNNGGSVKDVEIGTGSKLNVRQTTSLTVADGFVNNGKLDASNGNVTLSKGTAQGGEVAVGTLALTSGQSYTFGSLVATAITGGANLTIAANGTLSADSANLQSLTTGAGASVTGVITVAGATNVGSATNLSGNLTTASLTGGPLRVNNTATLTLTSSGTLGSVEFTGTNSLTASGTATVSLSATLTNANALTLKGKFDASNLTASKSDSKYVEGGSTANGFEQARLTLTIVNGGTTSANDATITFRGKTLSETVDSNGKVTFDGDVDYTKFYVNTGSEKVSTAMDKFSTTPGTFVLANTATLEVDQNIAMSQITLATGAAASLQIDNGSTVTTDGTAKDLTLSGAGTLAVNTGVAATGVKLADTGWTGTVSFTEAQLTTLDGAWKTGSTVSLTGVTGSLGNDLIKATVVLNKGTGDWGFGQTETVGTPYTNLEGTLTGAGNLGVKSGTVDSTFNLNGNIDDWTGNFIVATGADTDLNIGGNGPKTVHGTVSGSNLAVNVNADTTFEGALNVAEINVDASKAATLKADSTAGRVNAYNASLKVDDGKTLTVTGYAGPEGLKLGAGASIVLPGAAYLGGEDYGYIGGTVANGTSGDQAVDIHNTNITVTGTTLWADGGTGFTVDNKLVNATLSVENALTKAVVLSNVQDSLEVAGNLEIGTGGSLKVANGTAKQMLNISSGTLTTGTGSVIDADLALAGGTTAALNGTLDLNGGALTLNKGLTLGGSLYDQLVAIKTEGQGVQLFSNVGALTLTGSTGTSGIDATLYFTNLLDLEGDYKFLYEGGALSIMYSESTSRQLVWDGTDDEHSWVAYEPEAIDPAVKDWYQPSTGQETYFANGDTATFTSGAENTQVVISGDIEAKMVTVKDGAEYEYSVAADSTLASSRFEVKEGAVLDKTGSGELSLEVTDPVSVDGSTLRVSEGGVRIYAPEAPGALALANAAELEIAQDAYLAVDKLTGSADSTITMDGALTVVEGSVQAITAGENSTLTVNGGTLAIATDTTLYGLVNTGTLDLGTNDLTIANTTEYGGNVTAGTLHLAEYGSNFGDLAVNTIHYAYDKEGAGTLDYLEVSRIASNGAGMITLDMTDVRGEGGSLAPIQRTSARITYALVYATDQILDVANFTLDAATQELLVQNGLIHEGAGLEVNADDARILQLTIGGQDLTWYTDKDVTEWGYSVMSGDAIAHGANTLNGVQRVVVDHSRTVDVSGVGSEPGLRVRNIIGPDGRAITFTGTKADTVNLIATEVTSSHVGVNAENITLKVGLDELDEIDPVDYKDLHVGAVNLTGATLDVHDHEELDDSFSVDSLSGDVNSMLKGTLIVEGTGGAYRGSYGNAYVGLHEDAEQTLYAGEGLTIGGLGIAKLVYTGTETHMDGIEGIGMTVVLNSPEASNIGSTLVLDNTSWLANGLLVSGMSAMDSALTLDSADVPDLLDAPGMRMDGTTILINADATDEANIAMAVNDGGKKQNLLLARLGSEDSYTDDVVLNGYLYGKYYENARLEAGRLLVDRRKDFYTADVVQPTTENGRAGAGMLDDALLEINPQVSNPAGDLAAVMTALEIGAVANPDRLAAAVSGASAAALGHAYNDDVQRQLRAIRNRTTTMGLPDCTNHEGLPYVNAWVNAEGDYRKLDADGTLAGYTLSSWGGTIGFDVDLTNRLTLGAAFTVMHGEFTSHSADMCEGDLDRDYISLFARYGYRAWSNTLVATFGYAKSKLDRTVNYGRGGYATRDEADGNAFGIMYEVGYTKALNEDASTCIQPVFNVTYRHSGLGGYTEKGATDAALNVGDADMDAVTFGLGARVQSIIGTSVYNRATLFEGRVLAKMDAGDRDCTVNSSFTGVDAKRAAKSAEVGAFGVEVGAGLTIPVGETGGSIFLDVTGDFRSGATEFNGAAGYRFSF